MIKHGLRTGTGSPFFSRGAIIHEKKNALSAFDSRPPPVPDTGETEIEEGISAWIRIYWLTMTRSGSSLLSSGRRGKCFASNSPARLTP